MTPQLPNGPRVKPRYLRREILFSFPLEFFRFFRQIRQLPLEAFSSAYSRFIPLEKFNHNQGDVVFLGSIALEGAKIVDDGVLDGFGGFNGLAADNFL